MVYGLFAVAAVVCFYGAPIANWLKVFDYPRGGRKHHANPTPQVGGLAILLPAILWLAVQVLTGHGDPFLVAILLCGSGVGIIGIMDDQSHLSPALRLAVLSIFALIAFALDPLLYAPHIVWASFAPSAMLEWVFVACAVVAIAGFVSSTNMADGINGLVPSALLIWSVAFAVFGDGPVRELAIALAGPSLVVLAFNLRGRVFLGDCGTFGVGFLFALMAIASLRSGKIAAETMLVWFSVPVLDCLRVIITRLAAGRSPLKGGKDHFHHLLSDVFGKRRAFYAYTALILITSGVAALVPRSAVYILLALVAGCLGFIAARASLERQRSVTALVGARSAATKAGNPFK